MGRSVSAPRANSRVRPRPPVLRLYLPLTATFQGSELPAGGGRADLLWSPPVGWFYDELKTVQGPDRVTGSVLTQVDSYVDAGIDQFGTAPHRNHSLHADHTEADVWVIADHRSLTAIRPHLTVTVDGYSGLIRAYLWPSRPTGEKVAATLVETAAKSDYYGVTLGGNPEQLIVDNGGENLAGVVADAARRLGWIISPPLRPSRASGGSSTNSASPGETCSTDPLRGHPPSTSPRPTGRQPSHGSSQPVNVPCPSTISQSCSASRSRTFAR